ncbi:MAG TPA: hypothetical protein VNS88_11725, partial [Nitrospiraceae bacterium]|nr:hypothetical protein [Nitrospiraceae bacterium]
PQATAIPPSTATRTTHVKSLDTRNRSRALLWAATQEGSSDDEVRASALVGMAGAGGAGSRLPGPHGESL